MKREFTNTTHIYTKQAATEAGVSANEVRTIMKEFQPAQPDVPMPPPRTPGPNEDEQPDDDMPPPPPAAGAAAIATHNPIPSGPPPPFFDQRENKNRPLKQCRFGTTFADWSE